MDWIKRNLMFVIGALVALLLMVGAGFYTWSAWTHKARAWEDLDKNYAELKRLSNLNPNPGSGKVDNVKAAREQTREVTQAIRQVQQRYQPIAPIPEGGSNVTAQAFASRLANTILELQRRATNAGVSLLQPKYEFSFRQQNQSMRFAPGSVPRLAEQLGDVKTICDILIDAKINSLESLQRIRVSADDSVGPQTDYLELKPETNDLAILTPYQVTFRAFTPELAQVLCGFAGAPHGIMVKSLNIEPAPVTTIESPLTPAVTYVPVPPSVNPTLPRAERRGEESRFNERYGIGNRYAQTQPVVPTPAPVYAAPAASPAPRLALNERQLQVTMVLQVVKLLPKK